MNWKNDIQITEVKKTPFSNVDIDNFNSSIKEELLKDYNASAKKRMKHSLEKKLFSYFMTFGLFVAISFVIYSIIPKEIEPVNDFSQLAYIQDKSIKSNTSLNNSHNIEEKLEAVDPQLVSQYKILEQGKNVFFGYMMETKKMADKAIEENKKK